MNPFANVGSFLFTLPEAPFANRTADIYRRARLLYILCVNNIASLIGVSLYLAFTYQNYPTSFMVLLLVLLWVIGPIPAALVRKGYFETSRLMYWAALVIIEVASIWYTNGRLSPILMVALLMIMTMTSLLFAVKFSAFTLFGCAGILVLLFQVPNTSLGVTNSIPLDTLPNVLLVYYLIHLFLIGGLVNVGYLQMHNALNQVDKQRKQISDSEARYRRFTQTTKDTIIVLDQHGVIQFTNDALTPMFGYSEAEVVGNTVAMLMPPELRALHHKGFARYQKSQHRTLDWDFVAVPGLHKSGTKIDLEMSFTEYQEDDQPFYIGFIRNVTEQKRAEAVLQHSSKMESLGILAGGIAHDFNNLLVGMLAQGSLASRKIGLDHAANKHIERVLFAANRAADLTKQMLAYSGQGQFTIETINLNTLIQDNLALFQTSIAENVTLTTHFTADLPTIKADPTQMQQIFMNLIINASQAIDTPRGTITINTGRIYVPIGYTPQNYRLMKALDSGNYVIVDVEDNGSGMDAKTVDQIFDPFFTTKPNGTGLGLAAVLGIVGTHKGSLAVKSSLGKGTAFRIYLPYDAVAHQTPIVEEPLAAVSLAS